MDCMGGACAEHEDFAKGAWSYVPWTLSYPDACIHSTFHG